MLNYRSTSRTSEQLRRELVALLNTDRTHAVQMKFLDKTIRAKEYRRGLIDKLDYLIEVLDTLKLPTTENEG